jgi:hypothetical protein
MVHIPVLGLGAQPRFASANEAAWFRTFNHRRLPLSLSSCARTADGRE